MGIQMTSSAVSIRFGSRLVMVAVLAGGLGCGGAKPVASVNNDTKANMAIAIAKQRENLQKLDGWLGDVQTMEHNLQQQHGCVGPGMAEGFSSMEGAMSWAATKAENNYFAGCVKPIPGGDVDANGQKTSFAYYPNNVGREICGSTQIQLPHRGFWPEGNWAAVFYCGKQ